MPRPNHLNPSLRSRARTFATSLAHRVRLTEGAPVSRHSGSDLADWHSWRRLRWRSTTRQAWMAAVGCASSRRAEGRGLLCFGYTLASRPRWARPRARHMREPSCSRSFDAPLRGEDELLSRRHPANRSDDGDAGLGGRGRTSARTRGQRLEDLKLLRAMGPTSAMVLPVARRGRVLGSLTFVATRHSGRRYARGDVALASELARRAAIALERCARVRGCASCHHRPASAVGADLA